MIPRRRISAAALVVAIVALIVLSRGVHGALLRLLAAAETVAVSHPVWAAALVVVFAALAAMLVFVSSWVVVPFAVFTWGVVPALLLLWTGWLLGGATSYAIGRFLGRPAIRRLTSRELFARYEDRISRRTPFAFILLFQFAVPSEIPGYLLGLVRYSFLRYLAALSLVELIYGTATVVLGAGVVERRIGLTLAAAAMFVLLTALAVRGVRRRLVEPHRTAPAPRSSRPPRPAKDLAAVSGDTALLPSRSEP